MSIRSFLRNNYPFSSYGSLVFGGSLFLAGAGFLSGSAYELAAAVLMLLLLACGTVGTLLKRSAYRSKGIRMDRKDHLTAGPRRDFLVFRCPEWPFGLFFCLHIRVSGYLERGNQRVYRFRKEVRLDRAGTGTLLLAPPLSGILDLRIRFVLRDFLGLTGFFLDLEQNRKIPVLPRKSDLLPENLSSTVENQDDRSPSKPLEQEKVFNREYIPGDRFRDINWKAAERVQKILTRIPPEAQGSSRQIEILIQNLVPGGKKDFGHFCYEDCLKSLVFSFLENLQKNYPGWNCTIFYNRESYLLSGEESLFRFREDLCRKGAESLTLDDLPLPSGNGSCFLFTTCLNKSLLSYLSRTDRENLHLYLIQPFEEGEKKGGMDPDWNCRLLEGEGDFFPGFPLLKLSRPERISALPELAVRKEYTVKAVRL